MDPKVPSLGGFATKDAAENDSSVSLGFRINCKDNYFTQLIPAVINSILDDFIYPEIFELVKNAKITSDFKLEKAHIIMHNEDKRNEILLNDDVRFIGLVEFIKNANRKLKGPVELGEIKDILGLYPSPKNDPNAAHIMLFKFKGNWKMSYDLTYNLQKAKENIELAKKNLKTSELYLNTKQFSTFIDMLFNVTKLSISSLLLLHNTKSTLKIKYNHLEQLFSDYAKNGNIETRFSEYFKTLYILKKEYKTQKDREYSGNTKIDTVFLNTAKELITYIEYTFKSVYFYRQTPSGIYI